MSRAISRRDSMWKFTPKLRRRFKALELGASLGLLLLAVYPQTVSVVAQQEPPEDHPEQHPHGEYGQRAEQRSMCTPRRHHSPPLLPDAGHLLPHGDRLVGLSSYTGMDDPPTPPLCYPPQPRIRIHDPRLTDPLEQR